MAGSKFLENLIAGSSEKIQDVRKHIELAAPFPVSVMAVGPTGSGKELIAKGIHKLSGRSGKFIAVNSAAIPAELLEAELFGYEKGAFTGADKGRKGKVEDAGGGTLFLDEIGDMPLSLQAKLLRVLETKTVQKIGSEKSIPVDFRLVCATHTDIGEMARRGEFLCKSLSSDSLLLHFRGFCTLLLRVLFPATLAKTLLIGVRLVRLVGVELLDLRKAGAQA